MGVIIEESLGRRDVLDKLKIVKRKVEEVTVKHQTPWLTKWTLDTVEIDEKDVDEVVEELSESFDKKRDSSWYADFKNEEFHYIIFSGRIFRVDRSKKEEYQKVVEYGISLGIPAHQLDFF